MAVLQPDNLKLLARAALTNISQLMESQQPSPPLTTVYASIRVLTRVFPALLSDPGLRSWCWTRRRRGALSLSPCAREVGEEASPFFDRGGRVQQRVCRRPFPGTARSVCHAPSGLKRVCSPQQCTVGRESHSLCSPLPLSPLSQIASLPPCAGDLDPSLFRLCRPTAASPSTGHAEDKTTSPAEAGKTGGVLSDDFPVCFASVALHAVTNLLCFPGFCVDDEAAEWDDYYTPIPDLHYGIHESSLIWAPGVAVTEHNMRQVSSLDSHRVEVLRLLTALLSLPLFLDTPSARAPRTPSTPPPSSSSIRGLPLPNPVAALAVSRHLHFSAELFYSLINLAVVSRASEGGEVGREG
ncbi:unnamed protein product, partial [Scytosiphon promiscuus]